MKKVLFILLIVISGSNLYAQFGLLGAGASTKIHDLQLFGHNISEPTVNSIFEFGHRFEGEKTIKTLSIDLSLGIPSASMSRSFSKGISAESMFKFSIEQKRDNPLGLFFGASVGHLSTLPQKCLSETNVIIFHFGKENLEPFYQMARDKKRMVHNYVDLDLGLSYEHETLKFSGGYGVFHKSIMISVTRTLNWYF